MVQEYIPVEYRFDRVVAPKRALGRFIVAKFEERDEAPAAIYYVTVKPEVVECTCPAYVKPAVPPIACKHAMMVARWWLTKERKARKQCRYSRKNR